jgi:hypothetical protein
MNLRAFDPLHALSVPLEQLLAGGGDTRLNLDPHSQLNGYGCRPFPRLEAFTFASSTATSISSRAYAAAASARRALLRQASVEGFDNAFDQQVETLRDEIKTVLDIEDTGCEIVFSPSGTDSQLHALYLSRALLGMPLLSMIAAADETGSGAAFATSGRHFNGATAQGSIVSRGEPMLGLADRLHTASVSMRDDSGALRPIDQVDGDITHGIARAVASGKRVLLFAMDSSKFGLHSPSFDCLSAIASSSKGNVQIVIDACQARLSRKKLRSYLDQGFMVLITGSKFFTGAPFSGALLVPKELAVRCASLDRVPEGLHSYTSRADWPRSFPAIRAALPFGANIGSWLRWVSALEEMRAYFAVPASFRKLALEQFAETIPCLIEAEPCLEALPLPAHSSGNVDNEEFASRTIFPFFVQHKGVHLPNRQAGILYRALNEDVAGLLPSTLPPMLRLLAARRCHIGQPVAVADGHGGSAGALRISAGARFVSESWSGDFVASREKLRAEFDQVRAIIEKIALLVRYFDAIEEASARPRTTPSYQVSAA